MFLAAFQIASGDYNSSSHNFVFSFFHPFKMKLAIALAANAANKAAKLSVLISTVAAIMKASTTDIVPVALASFSRRFIVTPFF